MYFSLIQPRADHARVAAHERLHGPYEDHQWLWRWLPVDPEARRDFLFRRHESPDGVRYYLLSSRPPVEHLGSWSALTRPYAPQIEPGDRFMFELRANPTVRHDRDGKSRRHDVVMNAKRMALDEHGLTRWSELADEHRPSQSSLVRTACAGWLARRADRLGFAVDDTTLMVEGYAQHRERPTGDLRFSTVDFTGELTVLDPEAFRVALNHGIGSAKAFGCGLLLIRRGNGSS